MTGQLPFDKGRGGGAYYSGCFANHNAENGHYFATSFLSYLIARCTAKRDRDVFVHILHRFCGRPIFSGAQQLQGCLLKIYMRLHRSETVPWNTSFSPFRFTLNWKSVIGNGKYNR